MFDYKNEVLRYLQKGQQMGSAKKTAAKLIWMSLKYLMRREKSIKQTPTNTDKQKTPNTISLLVDIPGGIGDVVIALQYLYEMKQHMGNHLIIHVSAKAPVSPLLYGQTFIHQIVTEQTNAEYDVILQLARFPRILFWNEHIQNISKTFYTYCKNIIAFQQEHFILFEHMPYNDFLGKCYSEQIGLNRETQADITHQLLISPSNFRIHYNPEAETILKKQNIAPNTYITLQRGVGEEDIKGTGKRNTSTRLWSLEKYHQLTQQIKTIAPNLKIIQLGNAKCEPIKHTDIDLRGKTTFQELLVLLSHAKLHIDLEGGMVHLRHFLSRKPSVVLFGPTDEIYLGYPENINISKRTCKYPCDWMTPNWREKCAVSKRGNVPCMDAIEVSDVLARIQIFLNDES
mgnify:CR=1 FL=1